MDLEPLYKSRLGQSHGTGQALHRRLGNRARFRGLGTGAILVGRANIPAFTAIGAEFAD
jgi:hypothetical protein